MSFDGWDELVADMDHAHADLCAASARLLEAVSRFQDFVADSEGEEPITTWLAARYRESSATVAHWDRVAEALRELPAIKDAHREGRISWDQLKPLIRFATPESDHHHATEAQGVGPAKLWREAHRHRRVEVEKEAETDHQLRRAWMSWNDDRSFMELYAELPAEQGARVERALAQRAQDVVLEDGPVMDRAGARLADALVELVTGSGAKPPVDTLVIHTDAEVLLGNGGAHSLGETGDGIQLPDEAIRRVACDPQIDWVLESGGRAVGIGRKGRQVPGWLRRQIEHRDPECRFTGCSRTGWLVIHHLVPWALGGHTDLDNLVRVCTTHHRSLHEGGWKVTGHPDHHLRFHDPGGRPSGSRRERVLARIAVRS
jgi:Domain of unknown function (DUF222)/HNH endonuclease